MTLLGNLKKIYNQLGPHRQYWVAYSGGLDSHVLLHLCHAFSIENQILLRVIHINHGLHQDAEAWSKHCAAICDANGLPFQSVAIKLDGARGDSLEALGRKKRYAVFAEHMQPGDVLLTAHHQDDQAETFLLQLLRGAGLKGLAAMPELKSFGKGYHFRPLLTVSRDDIKSYAFLHSLNWIEDSSNESLRFDRNYLRHTVMPVLKSRYPSALNTIARSAFHCAEADTLLTLFGQQLLARVQGESSDTLSVKKLSSLSAIEQKLALRTWISASGYSLPEAKKLDAILRDVLTADWDRFPCVEWGEAMLRRHRDDLYLMKALPHHDVALTLKWQLSKPLILEGIGEFHAHQMIGLPLASSVEQVEVRFRQGGEILELPGRGKQSLKNLFQEWNIVPWQRDRIPLVYHEERLVGVLLQCLF